MAKAKRRSTYCAGGVGNGDCLESWALSADARGDVVVLRGVGGVEGADSALRTMVGNVDEKLGGGEKRGHES